MSDFRRRTVDLSSKKIRIGGYFFQSRRCAILTLLSRVYSKILDECLTFREEKVRLYRV